MLKNTVMVVCDNNKFLDKVEKSLMLNGFYVSASNDRHIVRDSGTHVIPDMLLFDFKIDISNGTNLSAKLNQLRKMMHIPVIKMVGYFIKNGHPMVIRVYGIGTCLKKSFHADKMITRIGKYTGINYQKMFFLSDKNNI
jgi:DNA-binding NtrC family response regulator